MILIDLNITEKEFQRRMKKIGCKTGVLVKRNGEKKEYILFRIEKNVTLIQDVPSLKFVEERVLVES